MKSKPDWKDAPEWARYLAMDEFGVWWWFEYKPNYGQTHSTYWGHNGGGHIHDGWRRNTRYYGKRLRAGINPELSLEKRPVS
jgi:hypothetical protein